MSGPGLNGKTAVLLGASSRYGGATAMMLALKGVKVALGGRSRQKLEALEEGIRASGGRALVVGTHLAKRHHPAHLVGAALEAFGGLDFLLFMACAAAPPLGSLDLDAWERSVEVNVKGFLYTLAAARAAEDLALGLVGRRAGQLGGRGARRRPLKGSRKAQRLGARRLW